MSAGFNWICLWLTDFFLAATILLSAVLAVGAVLREPVKRISLAWGTLCGLFVLAVLCAAPFWPRLSLLASANENTTAVALSEPNLSARGALPDVLPMQDPLSGPKTDALTEPKARVDSNSQQATIVTAAEPLDVRAVVATVFLIGAGGAVLWLLTGAVYSRRIFGAAVLAPEFVELELRAIAKQVRPLPIILVSHRIFNAAAYGLLRPAILLPADAVQADDRTGRDALRTLLAHEWAHIARRDLWLLALGRVLLVVLYAHPLYWLMRRKIRADQELVADAMAAEVCGRHTYAETLVHWARRHATALPRFAGALGIWERPSQLTRRITLLLDERVQLQTICTPRWRMTTTAAIAAAIVFLSLVTLRPSAAQTPSPQQLKYLTEMQKTAKKADFFATINYQSGNSKRGLESIYDWSRHRLETDLQIATTKDERIQAARAHQERMASEREVVHVLYKHGRKGGEADKEAATRYFLAEANRWVLEQTEGVEASKKSDAAQAELKTMRTAAREAVNATKAAYDAGTLVLENVYLWSKRLLMAELDGATPEAAKNFCTEHLQRVQQLHAEISAKHGVGAVGGETNLLNATKYYVAEAEFMLARLSNPKPDAQAMLAAASEAYKSFAALHRYAREDLGQVCIWSDRWLAASLDAATPPATAYAEQRARIKELYELIDGGKALVVGPGDLQIVQFYLAETDLQISKQAAN